MTNELTKHDFENLKGRVFQVRIDEENSVEATLSEVNSLNSDKVSEDRKEPFSIILCTALETILEQQIYTISRPEMQPVSIFIVPLGPVGDHAEHEAVFT